MPAVVLSFDVGSSSLKAAVRTPPGCAHASDLTPAGGRLSVEGPGSLVALIPREPSTLPPGPRSLIAVP
jgi:hypothetical protein